MKAKGWLLFPLIAAGVVFAAPSPAAETSVADFFTKTIGLQPAQIAAIERGDIVTKQLQTQERADVAIFGAMRVATTPDAYLAKLKDIVAFKRTASVIEIGKFSDPPVVADVAGLTMTDDDYQGLRECRTGDCDVKLARSAIDRLHAEVKWTASDARARATDVMRQMMVDFVTAYKRGGATELATYYDKDKPIDAAAEFKRLLDLSPYFVDYAPEFHAHVLAYPKGKLENVADAFYWIKDKNTPRATVSVHHVSIWKDPRGSAFVASKQIYASHYMRVGLDLQALVPASDGKGFYLIELFRSRIDPPGGMIGGALMGKIRGGIESSLGDALKAARTRTLAP